MNLNSTGSAEVNHEYTKQEKLAENAGTWQVICIMELIHNYTRNLREPSLSTKEGKLTIVPFPNSISRITRAKIKII